MTRNVLRFFWVCLLFTAGCAAVDHQPAVASGKQQADKQENTPVYQDFAAWKADFARRLATTGKLDDNARALLDSMYFRQESIQFDRNQPEFNKMVWSYLDNAVSAQRVSKGKAMARRYADFLQQSEQRYGVDKQYLLAIWGMESAFGANTGKIDLPSSLATLAYEGRRRDFAEKQLSGILQLLKQGDIQISELKGSWSGGMGHTQFIPTTFIHYGTDGNGDGRRDPWNIEDALASTANYLSQSGWQHHAPWGQEVRLKPGFDYRYTDNTLTVPQWRQLGVTALGNSTLPDNIDKATLWLPGGHQGPAFLLYPNFNIIKVYNNSSSYALGVSLLADAIAGKTPVTADWPRSEQSISRQQTQRLQQNLTRQGYDTQGIDGILGKNTRRAFRAWQHAVGNIPDGFISQNSAAPLLR